MFYPATKRFLPTLLPLLFLASLQAAPAGSIMEEEKVAPYTLPDPLTALSGKPVATPDDWKAVRRPELLKLFADNVYGKTLLGRPKELKFVVREEKKDARNGLATRLRVGILLEGREDGRQFEMLVYLPNSAKVPVPVFVGLNFDANFATTTEPDLPVATHWVNGLKPSPPGNVPTEAMRGKHAAKWDYDAALNAGFGVATAAYGQIEPDAPGRWKDGPRGLAPEPGPGDWGALGAWAWGLSRMADFLENDPRVDKYRLCLTGFSRIGKASLWAAAQDERFALVVSNNSGAGGAALGKRIFGETTAHLTSRFPHWFCGNFAKFADRESELPVDQHELIALLSPRPTLVLSATKDLWSDPKGEFLSAQAASPVFKFLGAKGLQGNNFPAPGDLVPGNPGYYLRDGSHDVTPEDWKVMLDFARMQLNLAP